MNSRSIEPVRGRAGTASIPTIPRGDVAVEQTPAEIESRFRWARKEGHVAYYWPDVPVLAWRACLHEIERVTQLVLAGHDTVEWVPPPGTDARAAGIAAFTSGMGPLLGRWVETGRLTVPPDLAAVLRLHLDHGHRRAARMTALITETLDLLRADGLRAVLIKSAHTARQYFPDPGARPAADIDLVVRPGELARANRILESNGYRLLKARRHPQKTDWAPPGGGLALRSIELTHAENPITIELHDSLDRNFFGVHMLRLADPDALDVRLEPRIHPAASVLTQPLLTAFLAAHASEELHQLQLVRIVELALVIRQDTQEGVLLWPELLELLRSTNGSRFVYPALELAEQLAPGLLPDEFRAEICAAATPRMRRVLESMSPATAQRLEGLSLDERFLWASGPVETARRFLQMLWPTRGESGSLPNVYIARFARLMRGRVTLRRRG